MHVYTIPDRFWGRCKRWHRSVLKTDPTLAIFLGSGAERRESQRCKNRSKDGAPNEGLSGMAFAMALKDKLNISVASKRMLRVFVPCYANKSDSLVQLSDQ